MARRRRGAQWPGDAAQRCYHYVHADVCAKGAGLDRRVAQARERRGFSGRAARP